MGSGSFVGLALGPVPAEPLDGALSGAQHRDVEVDGEDAHDLALFVADEDGGRLQDLAARGLGEVGEPVLEHGVLVRVERLEHDVRGAVAQLAARHVAVLDPDDGVVGVLCLKVVDDDLAPSPKLKGDGVAEALVEIELGFLHGRWLRGRMCL